MTNKSKYSGSGIRSNEVTTDINKVAYAKTMTTVSLCDAYREHLKQYPNAVFTEFKKQFLKKNKKRFYKKKN